METVKWRRFEEMDWRAFAGAECYPDGSPPHIAEWQDGDVLILAVVGPERAHVEALNDDGEQVAILSYESSLTLLAAGPGTLLAELRALPGVFDHQA